MLRLPLLPLGKCKYLVDGSPAYFWEYDEWKKVPANKGLDEPRVTQAHTLRSVSPSAKVVIMLRNPIDR